MEMLVLTSFSLIYLYHRVASKMVDMLVYLYAVEQSKNLFLEVSMSAVLDLTKKMHKKNTALQEKLSILSSMSV